MLNIPVGFSQVKITIGSLLGVKKAHFGFGAGDDNVIDVLAATMVWLDTGTDPFKDVLYAAYYVDQVEVISATERATEEPALFGTAVAVGLMPPQVVPVIKKIASVRGKGKQGRMFWPGCMAEADVDNSGYLDPGHRSDLQDAAASLFAGMATAGSPLNILHQVGDPAAPTPVVNVSCEAQTASIGRRNR